MRVLVHADTLGESPGALRLQRSALGLALRGHIVEWAGPAPPGLPASAPREAGPRALWTRRADLVLGGGKSPQSLALAGRLAGADAMVVAPSFAEAARWGSWQRWGLHWLDAFALVEPAEAESFRQDRRGIALDRVALWSDAEPAPLVDAAHPDVEILERACHRALARSRTPVGRAAAFVDRDGTVVREVGYLADPDDLELLPGAAEALLRLRAAGYALVLISNQSGVGRGLFSIATVYAAMARLRQRLREHAMELDAIYFCPHRPDAGCACRKPGTALLERAADDLRLSLGRSVMIGDKLLDPATAHAAGARGILVRTGYGRDEEQRWRSGAANELDDRGPDAVCDDLGAAADWILAHGPEP
jgi:histidinol-phosphate phosphatase family protein